MTGSSAIPFVSVSCEGAGASTRPNELGMRPMQERAWERRGEQYLPVKSPPASGKSRALMFIALDKLHNQGLKQAVIAVPERTIGASFADARLAEAGFWADWTVRPRWNLCNAPGRDNDEAPERICIGRRFRNDTERLEKLLEMYSRTAREGAPGKETAR